MVHNRRSSQILAWAVASLFTLGFFFPLIGTWTSVIAGVWFVGTQKPWRGFLWMAAFAFVPHLFASWRTFPLAGPQQALEYVAWMLLAALLGVLPFTFHRLVSPRLPGFLSTLPFPLAAVALETLVLVRLPKSAFNLYDLSQSQKANTPLLQIGAVLGIAGIIFLIDWFAAVVLWMWNHEFRAAKIARGASLFAAVYVLAAGYGLFRQFCGAVLPQTLPTGTTLAWICLGGAFALSAWAVIHADKHRETWADKPESVARLQSPYSGERLQVVREQDGEVLRSPSGERFPIHHGIPVFLKPEDLTGLNRKYNHLYETIGGFYDDTQRVVCALRGWDRNAYVLSYLGLLEIKAGDTVLETSVGTGLNFQYLPRDIKRSGLDLSPEMLANCQANLRRWQMDADLFLGNAESLPFADASFDVVFHVGGINFFNDRAKAIREMIRVAKPGSRLLIADETEEHVKSAYEHIPITSGYFKNRKQAVTAPTDLLPPEMQEVHLETLGNGRFYALTFRKPAPAGAERHIS
jgi:ubiquinone/menaquinone biosynthesis C-methylase UbiE